MKFVVAFVLGIAFSTMAIAQHSHGAKGPNGGETQDVAGVEVELVTAGNTVTLYVADEKHKPVSVKGFTASVLLAGASGQEPVTLEPAGENILKGSAKSAIGPGTTITVMLKTAAGKSGQVRFKK